jgi:hypothetical protein
VSEAAGRLRGRFQTQQRHVEGGGRQMGRVRQEVSSRASQAATRCDERVPCASSRTRLRVLLGREDGSRVVRVYYTNFAYLAPELHTKTAWWSSLAAGHEAVAADDAGGMFVA